MSSKIRLLIIIPFILGRASSCIAQMDSGKIKTLIYNQLYKNIASYYITYAVNNKTDLNKKGYLREGVTSYFFDQCLPDNGYNLEMEISKLNWTYPIDNFDVYQVQLNGLRFSSSTSKRIKLVQTIDGPTNAPPSNYYLLCIDRHIVVKFVSGSCFLNDVSNDFKLNNLEPQSYVNYLKFKTFQYQITQILFAKKRRHYFYYTAFSNQLNSKVMIIVDINSPSNPRIKLNK